MLRNVGGKINGPCDTLTMGRVKDEGTMILREYVDSQMWRRNTANLG